MKKQRKQMLVTIFALVLAVAAYIGLKHYNTSQEEKKAAQTEAEKVLITDFETGDITAFSYQLENETLSFVKEDTWKCEENPNLKLDESVIHTMLSDVSALEAENSIETENLEEYGFGSPRNVLTFTTKNGTTTLTLGMENTITGQYYVRKNEETILYLITTDLSSAFSKTLDTLEAAEEEEPEETENQE